MRLLKLVVMLLGVTILICPSNAPTSCPAVGIPLIAPFSGPPPTYGIKVRF